MTDNIVEIDNLSFGYSGRMLHKGINMSFPRGKVVAIMGRTSRLWQDRLAALHLRS